MKSARQLMADAKFYEAYSRYLDNLGRYETWDEAVERVMSMHKNHLENTLKIPEYKLKSVMPLLDEVQEAYKNKLILGAQRALQFGGEQLLKHQARMYNCFHQNTTFITSDGVRTFADFSVNDRTSVLTHTGKWQSAIVKSYGEQQLFDVTFRKGTNNTTVKVTRDHRWLLKDGTETTHLNIGDNILKPFETFAEFDYLSATPIERLYWCYGMVYGDGTRIKNKEGEYEYSLIRLCGADKQFASRFEEMGFKTSTNSSLNGDFIAYTGTYLKTTPDPTRDSPELIRAFVAGYLQADGEKNSNNGTQYLSIQSSEEDHINFIRNCFPIAGVFILSETELTGQQTNYGVRPYTISFRVTDSFGSKYNAGWKVVSIEPSSTETVWCLEVENDHSFLLANGIVTGNCAASYCDRPEFFGEAFYLMLCGTGVGFSVQKHHVSKLPSITRRTKMPKEFVIPDSIEGWAMSADILLSSFFVGGGKHPEYEGRKVLFNFDKIRPKGAYISGGFKAPSAEPLRKALTLIEELIKSEIEKGETKLRPIVAYDIVMYIADAVISGGVRRSACICIFSKDDDDMLKAKTGDWFVTNPQRGRSNNSALLLRNEVTKEELDAIMQSVKEVGEPKQIWAVY